MLGGGQPWPGWPSPLLPVFTCAEQVCNCYLAESLKGFNEMTYVKEFCELQ